MLGLLAALVLTGVTAGSAAAQAMVDPMRPPDAVAAAGARGEPRAGALQGAITSSGRKLALIDGTVVPLGGAVREGTLTGLSDNTAVLKKNRGRDVLLMHPNIDKRPARPQESQ